MCEMRYSIIMTLFIRNDMRRHMEAFNLYALKYFKIGFILN